MRNYGKIAIHRGEAKRGPGICQGAEIKRLPEGWISGGRGQRGDLVRGTFGHHELSGGLRRKTEKMEPCDPAFFAQGI